MGDLYSTLIWYFYSSQKQTLWFIRGKMNPRLGDYWILTAVLWRLVQDHRDSQYFQGQKSKAGKKSNWESISGNQTHQWKEHFWQGGPYLLPSNKQKTTSTCSIFNLHPSQLPKVPIWLVMDQMGLNVGLHPYGWSWAAISPGQQSGSWLSRFTAEVVAAERMIKHSVHGSKWFLYTQFCSF